MNARKRDLIGRRIVDVEWNRFYDRDHGWITQPELTLDNGTRLWFVTQETDVGEYGTAICVARIKSE